MRKTERRIVVPEQFQVRIDEKLRGELEDFCNRTRRQYADVVRDVMWLFLEDGRVAAEERLTLGLWEAVDVDSLADYERGRAIVRAALAAGEVQKRAPGGTRQSGARGA